MITPRWRGDGLDPRNLTHLYKFGEVKTSRERSSQPPLVKEQRDPTHYFIIQSYLRQCALLHRVVVPSARMDASTVEIAYGSTQVETAARINRSRQSDSPSVTAESRARP